MRDNTPTIHHVLPNKTSNTRNVLHLFELLSKGRSETPLYLQAFANPAG